MGYLDGGGESADGASEDAGGAEAAEGEERQAPAAEVEKPEAPAQQARVPIAPPGAKPSRRQKAADDGLRADMEKLRQESSARAAADAAELGRLRGSIETLTAVHRQPPREAAPAAPDPDALEKEAIALLDQKDFAGYQRKTKEAAVAQAMLETRKLIQESQRQQPQRQEQLHPGLIGLIAQHQNVATKDPDLKWVQHFDRELEMDGVAPGPQRVAKAFALANNRLGGASQSQPQFSQSSRAALTDAPMSRHASGGNGNGAPGITPNEVEEAWRKAAGMSKEEYYGSIAEHHPERVER